MEIPQIDPAEASRRMGQGHIYLDVRSSMEFGRGHAAGAVNVPLLEFDPAYGQLAPNPDFIDVCLANFPKDAKLVVGCMSGSRSQAACEYLASMGYASLANILGGFGGARDPQGQVMAKGWSELGLPVSTDVGEGVAYSSLLRKAQATGT